MAQKVGKADEQKKSERPDATEEGEQIQVVDKRRFARLSEGSEPAPEPEAARYPSYVEELQSRLKQAEEQAERLQARYKQAQAELGRETEELRTRLQRN